MTINEAHRLVNNLDYEDGLRRTLSPRHSLIQVNRNGEVEAVYRFKHTPTEQQQYSEALSNHPKTIQIPARVGTYETIESLEAAIEKRMWLFEEKKR